MTLCGRGGRPSKLGIAGQRGSCHSLSMERDRAIEILREHAPELKKAGVKHLRVFGSVARGDASSTSDVDLLTDFDKSRRFTLVTLGGLESRLTDLLGVKVDLSSPECMRDSIRDRVLQEAISVF
jgi:predicted nucleotidyltransferase